MKKLIALLLTLALAAMMLPCIAVADEAVDTSEHVVITYMVTGDKPTNKTDEVLAKTLRWPPRAAISTWSAPPPTGWTPGLTPKKVLSWS